MQVKILAITQPIDETWNQETLIEYCGRVCTNTTEKTGNDSVKFIKTRMKQNHQSIIEHCSATFEISGISRTCSHQLVRHRIASYSQQSQRYVDSGDFDFVMPDGIPEKDANAFLNHSRWFYKQLRRLGIKKEDSRFFLPEGTTTRIVVTMNFRSWLHFINERMTPQAQHEIREVATRVYEILSDYAPSIFEGLRKARI